jgi:hypothetical protein
MARLGFASCYYALLALAVAACDASPVQPAVQGVLVSTDASEYAVSSPPQAAFATLENRTNGAVTVRRCLAANSPIDPVGLDLVVEKQQVNGSWQAVDFGFDCIGAGAPRADAVLAPYEAALILRLIATTPGRYRIRVAYGVGIDAAPTDTATSAVFSYR